MHKFAFTILFQTAILLAQNNTASIEGTVTDALNKKPLEGALPPSAPACRLPARPWRPLAMAPSRLEISRQANTRSAFRYRAADTWTHADGRCQ